VEQARQLLARFELSAHESSYAGELSGGQRRLVEIMRAMMSSPRMLLLDEPLAGVNRGLGRHIEDALLELRGDGLTMLMVEHELGCIERICDSVIVMAQGHVIAQGTMQELRTRQEVLDAYLAG
jgi:branched-chain amino acid transport system ATP-binding protein